MTLRFRNQQIFLISAEIFVSCIAFLAFQSGVQTQAGNCNVSSFGIHGCLSQPVIRLGQAGSPVFKQMASQTVQQTDSVLFTVASEPFQESDIPAACAVIVSFQCRNAVRVGTDNGYGTDVFRIQRQNAVILKQYHALFSGFQGQRSMFIRVVIGNRNTVIFTVICEQAEQESGGKKPFTGGSNIFFSNQTFLQRFQNVEISVAAVQVTSVFNGQGSAFGRGCGHFMIHMEITDGPAVTDHMTFESPFFAQCFFQKGFTAAGGFSVHPVIGAHH